MLRLHDPATMTATPVVPARRGQLTTYIPRSGPGDQGVTGALRSFLVADLIQRIAQRHGLLVTAWHGAPGAAGPDGAAADRDALNIYPAQFSPGPPEPLDIAVGQPPPGHRAGPPPRWVTPAPVIIPGPAAGPVAAALTAAGLDPLALRLALLRHHYRSPASLGWPQVTAADADLRRWRAQVAEFARSPSRAMPRALLAQITGAIEEDLAVPPALRALTALAQDATVEPGAKFETFAHLDQILGLDLAREVGR